MSKLFFALFMGGYIFLILPAILLILATVFDRSQNPEQPSRRRLFAFVSLTAFVLALLDLLIWYNPYGREINSSISAIGVLVVFIALLTYLLHHSNGIARLWPTDKALLIIFALIYLGLFGFLWFADHAAFYVAVVLALFISLVWWYIPRASLVILGSISLLTLCGFVITTGGWFFIPGADQPSWSRIVFSFSPLIFLLLSIFLPAGLFYSNLRTKATLKKSELAWSLVILILFLVGIAYQNYWEGIWSSAHARAFEDHLPFNHFILSLVAGVIIALMLNDRRRWAGPLYTILVTTLVVLSFIQGWNVSAFDLTEQRAEAMNRIIMNYHHDHGSYPENLAELTPDYMLIQLPPVVVRQGGWCYQAGKNYFRLGYISGNFTYFDANFKVVNYAQAGDIPDDTWVCDSLLERFQTKELRY